MIQIYNSLTKRKETFQPIHPGKVGIYVCGLTVYDHCHIGNARLLVVFDMVVRYFKERGNQVTYVRNITDIDDKIIKRAQENGEDFRQVVERYTAYMHEVTTTLNLLLPDIEPKATDHIDQIIELVEKLMAKGYAYAGSGGDVYFAVDKFPQYGKLAHRDLEALRAGIRVDVSEDKLNPLDFVLWKMAKPGEPAWDSPWGKGRPGWHIECSAMSTCYLGDTFDIHGGGSDLLFPHHQNEVAQSEAATGKKYVNTWMHVGFVQVDKQKMSKSLGNFFTTKDVLQKYDAEVLRYFMLASHYRSPVNYSEETLQVAKAALERFYIALRDLAIPDNAVIDHNYQEKFYKIMDDDFNTPEAIALLFDIAHKISHLRQQSKFAEAWKLAYTLKKLGAVIGIVQKTPEDFLQVAIDDARKTEIEALIKKRTQARNAKNWQLADEIRDQLREMGVELEDATQGTIWRQR